MDIKPTSLVIPYKNLSRGLSSHAELSELVWVRPDERHLTVLREHQQQVLVGQQHDLAVAVASVLPLALAVHQVNAREYAAIEAEERS